MADNSSLLTSFLTFLLLGSYFFITATNTNYDALSCKQCAKEYLLKTGNKVEGVLFVPKDPVKKVLLGLIYQEQEYIKAAVYHLTDPDLIDALLDAQKRGVKIEVITDKSCLNSKHGKIIELQTHNIPVYVYSKQQFSIMHHKFWVFGRNLGRKPIIWSGSANATKGGTTRNRENVFINDRPDVIKQYREEFDQLKKKISLAALPKPRTTSYNNLYLRFLYDLRKVLRPSWIFK